MQAMTPRARWWLLAATLTLLAGCADEDVPFRSVGPNWMRHGMLAGSAVYLDISAGQLDGQLDQLVAEHVDVVIADSSLSNYMSDTAWDEQMELVNAVTQRAHKRGLKVIWYLTSLEVQTEGGRLNKHSMYKHNPSWVQESIEGEKNVFYGNKEDWVAQDDESAWMCPISGYRKYFLDRIKKLAGTSVDGIWVDVPTYMDTAVEWSCACKLHRADFNDVTGMTLGKLKDWKSPAFRRWAIYRHEELRDFQKAVHAAARSVNPKIESIFEIFSTDTIDCTETGLDASYMGNNAGISHVWEIDSVSNGDGMLRAKRDDWISKITITKYARGADKGRPTWVFAYGNTEWDAQMVFATALAGQANPYETKTPEMATSVGSDLRKRLYRWVDPHKKAIYDSTAAARVGVLYSSHTRDFLDNRYGFGLFTDTQPPVHTGVDPKTSASYTGPDRQWWAKVARYSAASAEFLGEYRGFAMALAQLHVPFAIEPMQHQTPTNLARYDLLIAPNLVALDDKQAKLLIDYVTQGGQLLVTGPAPSSLDGTGTARKSLALAKVLGFDLGAVPAVNRRRVQHSGLGRVTYLNSLPGRSYLRTRDQAALAEIQRAVQQGARIDLGTTAAPEVYLDLYRSTDQLVLHAINLVGVDGSGTPPKPQQVPLSLRLPAGTVAKAARVSTPDAPGKDQTLQLDTSIAGVVQLTVPLKNYSLVLLDLAPRTAAAASLELQVSWPTGLIGAGLTARLLDHSSLTRRRAHLTSAQATATLAGLPAGDHVVELSTMIGGELVGQLHRGVTLTPGSTTKLAVTPGLSLVSGPAALTAAQHDRVFLYNPGSAAATATVGSKQLSVPAGKAAPYRCDTLGAIAVASAGVSASITVQARDAVAVKQSPTVKTISATQGYAGHSVELRGQGFGSHGRVLFGSSYCTVTHYSDELVVATIPDAALPGASALTVERGGSSSSPRTFTVLANPVTQTAAIAGAYAFVKAKMRSPLGGVYTNYKDVEDPITANLVYPNGHHQTAEHTGLLLWVSAALLDHATFEQTYAFIRDRMVSPRRGLVNWAINKKTNQPMLQEDTNSNAPLDDFRVVKALFAGYDMWADRRYLDLALTIGRGMYETCLTDAADYPRYKAGLVAYSYNWKEHKGMGETDADPIPVDYSDLYVISRLSKYDARWTKVLADGIRFLEDSQIASSGQYWNSYIHKGFKFSGDFEYRTTKAADKIKTIQSLWIAIHLARVGRTTSARKALAFYRAFYATHKRIAEYYNADGSEPTGKYFATKLKKGEPRIYAQLVRLALYLGQPDEVAFAKQLIADKLASDVVTSGPVKGHIGKSVDPVGDANAYNSLESLVALCFAQGAQAVAK